MEPLFEGIQSSVLLFIYSPNIFITPLSGEVEGRQYTAVLKCVFQLILSFFLLSLFLLFPFLPPIIPPLPSPPTTYGTVWYS